MSEIKKCPKCGGTVHTKIAGNYICSQCGNAIPESEVIIVKEPEQTNTQSSGYEEFPGYAKYAADQARAADSGTSEYTDFTKTPPEPPKQEKTKQPRPKKEKKQKKPKEPRQRVRSQRRPFSLKDIDLTLWWPILAAGVAGIDFTIVFILMIGYKFRYMPVWCTLLGLSAYLMTSLLLWPVFDKAGESPWKALIPIYSSYTLYEISGYKGWMFFLTLIPTIGQLIGCVLGALTAVSLAKKFGRNAKWGIIYLFLLCFAGWVMIAVTNMTYNRNAGHSKDMSPFQII